MTTWLPVAIGLGLTAYLCLDALLIALRGWRGAGRFADRWDVLSRTGNLVGFAVILLLAVQWIHLPAASWAVAVVFVAAALSGSALRWPELPWRADDEQAATRRAGAIGGLVLLAVLLAVAGYLALF